MARSQKRDLSCESSISQPAVHVKRPNCAPRVAATRLATAARAAEKPEYPRGSSSRLIKRAHVEGAYAGPDCGHELCGYGLCHAGLRTPVGPCGIGVEVIQPMEDFLTKLLLAFIAFLLGLLADAIKKVVGREKRRISYSISEQAIVAISRDIPEQVRSASFIPESKNIARFQVILENTGTKIIKDASCVMETNEDAKFISRKIFSTPADLVPYEDGFEDGKNRGRINKFSLEPRQKITCELFVSSDSPPQVRISGSGGDDVTEWRDLSSGIVQSIDEHAIAILKFWIAASFAPALFQAVAFIVISFLSSIPIWDLVKSNSAIQIGGAGLAQITGHLISLYCYIKIIPHASALIKELTTRRTGAA